MRSTSTMSRNQLVRTRSIIVAAADDGWEPSALADGSGRRVRKSVTGRSKSDVLDKLKESSVRNWGQGIHSKPNYTVQDAVEDWLANSLSGRTPKTVTTQHELLKPITESIGSCEAPGTDCQAGPGGASEDGRCSGGRAALSEILARCWYG